MSSSSSSSSNSSSSTSSSSLPDPSQCLPYLSSVSPQEEYNSDCGYCASKAENRVAYGVSTYRLTCIDYQYLIDYGWRRSGNYIYKPTNNRTCCPNLTIRNNVYDFVPSRQQKKLVRNFNRYLRGEINLVGNSEEDDQSTNTPENKIKVDKPTSTTATQNTQQQQQQPEGKNTTTTSDTVPSSSSNPLPKDTDEIIPLLSSIISTVIKHHYPSLITTDGTEGSTISTSSTTSFTSTTALVKLFVSTSSASSVPTATSNVPNVPPQYTSMVAFQIYSKLLAQHGGKKRVVRKPTTTNTTTEITIDTSRNTLQNGSTTNIAEDGTVVPSPFEIASLLVATIETNIHNHQYDIDTVPSSSMINDYTLASSSSSSSPHIPAPLSTLQFTAASTGHINIFLPYHQLRILSMDRTLTIPVPVSSFSSFPSLQSPHSVDTQEGSKYKKSRQDTSSSSSSSSTPPFPSHTFRVDTVPAAFEPEAFELYSRYQKTVHKDKECTVKQYTNFLCMSPLLREPRGAPIGMQLGLQPLNASTRSIIQTIDQSIQMLAKTFSISVDTVRKLMKDNKNDVDATYKHILSTVGATGAPPVRWDSTEGKFLNTACTSLRTHWEYGSKENRTNDPLLYSSDSGSTHTTLMETSLDPFHWVKGFPHEKDYVFPDLLDSAQNSSTGTDLSCGYGAFHQRYYLDEKLIAVGVIDILPSCLSSVYLFYDPDISKVLPLGKLTALREIQWVQATAARTSPRLHWYYLGFVIVSCPKMRYKLDYKPTEILCPYTHNFVPLTDAILHRLDKDKYSVIDTSFVLPSGSTTTTNSSNIGSASSTVSLFPNENELQSLAKEQYPQYKRLKEARTIALITQIPLLLSSPYGIVIEDANNLATCRDINPKAKDRITKLLKEYLFRVPPEIVLRLVVRFG